MLHWITSLKYELRSINKDKLIHLAVKSSPKSLVQSTAQLPQEHGTWNFIVVCCLAWLRERRSGRLLSTPTAGWFEAEEADARQAGPRAVSAHVDQVWVLGGGSSLNFPPLSFVFEGVSPVLFKL